MLIGWQASLWGSRSTIASCVLFVASFWWALSSSKNYHRSLPQIVVQNAAAEKAKPDPEFSATITPGDAEIERGSRLVVEATFAKDVPADATLIVSEIDGKERDRIPMRLTVDEKVFGGMIAKVDKDARYHVEFGDGKSKQHTM